MVNYIVQWFLTSDPWYGSVIIYMKNHIFRNHLDVDLNLNLNVPNIEPDEIRIVGNKNGYNFSHDIKIKWLLDMSYYFFLFIYLLKIKISFVLKRCIVS